MASLKSKFSVPTSGAICENPQGFPPAGRGLSEPTSIPYVVVN